MLENQSLEKTIFYSLENASLLKTLGKYLLETETNGRVKDIARFPYGMAKEESALTV